MSGITNAIQISAGYYYTCAVLSNHKVECWGNNVNGEPGNGTSIEHSSPVAVSGITNAIQISASAAHTCAVLSDGTVKCWGFNVFGQLGNGTTGVRKLTLVRVSGISDAN